MPAGKPPVSALISAEHASNAVPATYRSLFAGNETMLDSHHAWDPGSRNLARKIARVLNVPRLEGRVTRLLVDLNRSANHPRRLSAFSKVLPAADRIELIQRYWEPHWKAYADTVARMPGQVVHIACHSFTPVLDGKVRGTDIGLLFDPSRKREKAWCRQLQAAIQNQLPDLKVHMNQPYRGTSNGLGQQHRKVFNDRKLITLEIEVNTELVDRPHWADIEDRLVSAVKQNFCKKTL
jgi:predicted N-formylglutamate amidohydrolase